MFEYYGPGKVTSGKGNFFRGRDYFLDLGDEFDTSNVEDITMMFYGIQLGSSVYLRLGKKFSIDRVNKTDKEYLAMQVDAFVFESSEKNIQV
jgi:hypothetical protein